MFVEYHGITYDVCDFYPGSEDWMGYQLEYCNDTDPTVYYVGGIEIRPTSSTTCHVYLVDLNDGDFPEHLLFSWNDDWEDGEWLTFGDWDCDAEEYEREYRALFMWMLCDAVENYFN